MSRPIDKLQWVHVSEDLVANPATQYAIKGDYVYERTPTRDGGYLHRRAPWAKVVESTSLLDQPLGIWESVDEDDDPSDPQRIGPQP
jgi:hypothetical protein